MSDKLIICTVILVLLVIYLNYTYSNQNIEPFAVCGNEHSYIGNQLIKRDGTNLTYDPPLSNGIDPKNAILGYGSTGWDGNINNELVVRFNTSYSLKSIIIGGYGRFKISVEIVDTSNNTRAWKTLHTSNNTVNSEIFNGGNTSIGYTQQSNSSCFDLTVDNNSNIICQAIKFKVYQVPKVKAQFEVFGLELDANPAYQNTTYLNGYSTLLDENGNEIIKSGDNILAWIAESGNADPKCTVKFTSSDSLPIANKLISYIEFQPNNNVWITSFNISFSYIGSEITRHINDIPGNTGIGTTTRYYFKYPLLASELVIKPTTSTSFDSSTGSSRAGCKIKLFGKTITSISEENTLKAEQETYYQINNNKHGKKTCPPINSLINKQAEIQQLCDALEQGDEIEYEKKKIDTNKMYQLKLAQQKKEIMDLQTKISSMRDTNKQFNDIEDRNKLALFQYQTELDNKLKNLVKKRLDKQSAINLNFSLKDTLVKPDNVVETFYNYNKSNLSNKFINRTTKIPPEHFYEEFVGSHYFN